MNYTMQDIRRAWLDAADAEWKRGVRDDDGGIAGDRDIISGYFTAVRWDWHVPGGYVERPDNPWCGIGLGAMGRRIGDYLEPGQCVPVTLDPDVAYWTLPSTRRMASAKKWKASGSAPPRVWTRHGNVFIDLVNGVARSPEEILVPGIIATITARKYGDVRDDIGGHFVMPRYYDVAKNICHTVEFNGRGKRGDGTNGEGVVHAERPLSVFRRVYELSFDHIEQMERP